MRPFGVALLASLTCVGSAFGEIVTVDQENVVGDGPGYGIQAAAPIGQEFVPRLPFLDVVEVRAVRISGSGPPSVTARIRDGTIDGRVLGSSAPVQPTSYISVMTLRFPRLSLSPGATYVLELSSTNLRDGVNLANKYAHGTLILSGSANTERGLWFREGLSTPVAVVAQTWQRVKALYR